MALIAGARSYHQVHATVRAGFLPVMKISWVTSPLALAFAQKFLPEQTWVPFFNVVSFIIGTYINAHTKKKRLAALRRKVSNHRIPCGIAQALTQPSTTTIERLVEQATTPDRTIRTGQCRCILLAFGWFVYWMYRIWARCTRSAKPQSDNSHNVLSLKLSCFSSPAPLRSTRTTWQFLHTPEQFFSASTSFVGCTTSVSVLFS